MSIAYTAKASIAASTSNPVTASYTCATGTKLLTLAIIVGSDTQRTGGAPTYNSVAMTQAGSTQQYATSPETSVELWYLIEPGTGSAYTISIPNSGTLSVAAVASNYSPASGNTIQFIEAAGATGLSTNPTGSAHSSCKAGDMVLSVVGTGYDTATSLAGSDTLLYEVDAGTWGYSTQYALITKDGSETPSWTLSSSDDWAVASALFREITSMTTTMGISKAIGYAALNPPAAALISKVVAYAVLVPPEESTGAEDPMFFIF